MEEGPECWRKRLGERREGALSPGRLLLVVGAPAGADLEPSLGHILAPASPGHPRDTFFTATWVSSRQGRWNSVFSRSPVCKRLMKQALALLSEGLVLQRGLFSDVLCTWGAIQD